MIFRLAGVLAGGLAILTLCGDGRAEEPVPPAEALYAANYGYVVCEYCGLVNFAVHDGFRRETTLLIERENMSEAAARKIRLRAWTDADLEWGNRGLGGFRNWCRTVGTAAAQRFIDFRNARLAEEAKAGEDGAGHNGSAPVQRAP
jgi:hypothetical protein